MNLTLWLGLINAWYIFKIFLNIIELKEGGVSGWPWPNGVDYALKIDQPRIEAH